MELLFWIGLLLLLGYISKIVSDKFHLPSVTIYIILGIILSPTATHILPISFMQHTGWIIDFSLAVIAFIVGGTIKIDKILSMKKTILYITFFQAQLAFLITFAALYFILPLLIENSSGYSDFIFYFSISLFLGALASTTAPTTTVAIIEEYKSAGIVTTALLAIVAIDDIISILNYSLSVWTYSSIVDLAEKNYYLEAVISFSWHIFASTFMGAVFALFSIFIISKVHNKNTLSIGIGNILLAYTISYYLELEALLSIMVFGLVLSNRSNYFESIFKHLEENYLDIIFMLFFIVTGASIDVRMLFNMWHIALIYVFFRGFGKIYGAYLGARLSHARKVIRQNVGFALIPQEGVALGLAMFLYKEFPANQITTVILNTILATTIIHELIGPLLTKFALKRANEIK